MSISVYFCRYLTMRNTLKMASTVPKTKISLSFQGLIDCERIAGHRQIGAVAGQNHVMARFLAIVTGQNHLLIRRGVANARGLAYL